MSRIGAVLGTVLALGVCAAEAQDREHPLRTQSQQDFFRVFGTSPGPDGARGVVQGATNPGRAIAAARSVLEQNSDPIDAIVALTDVATGVSTDSNVLLALLGSGSEPLRYLMMWHQVSLDVTAIDHAPTAPGVNQQQVGPARSSRALALVHQAMFEAANAFNGNPYRTTLTGMEQLDTSNASEAAAITEAAYLTLEWLYPGLKEIEIHSGVPAPAPAGANFTTSTTFSRAVCPDEPELSLQTYHVCSLALLANQAQREKGLIVGRQIFAKIKAARANDNADVTEPELGPGFDYRVPEGATNRVFRQWLQDPVSRIPTALGGNWSEVTPFALDSNVELRPSPDAAPKVEFPKPTGNADADRAALLAAVRGLKSYAAVVKWGGEGRYNEGGKEQPSQPGGDGFFLAQYWAYDGVAYLCAPPRLYNQMALKVLQRIRQIDEDGDGTEHRQDRAPINTRATPDVARFLALINIAMADAAIASWDAKYHFQIPRPVTYIRAVQALDPENKALRDMPAPGEVAAVDEENAPTEPAVFMTGGKTAELDVTPATITTPSGGAATTTGGGTTEASNLPIARGIASKPKWFPTGAQVTNSDSPSNITPPFPAYVSGHATFGGAVSGVLRQFIGSKAEFTFRSDEFNGRNKDVFNYVRCDRTSDMLTPDKFCEPRTLTLDCAERENADSRLWMGVHWIDDADDGIVMGNRVARKVYRTMMEPSTGGVATLPQIPFSVKATDYTGNLREALVCGTDLSLPTGWADEDGTVGFGELELIEVGAAD